MRQTVRIILSALVVSIPAAAQAQATQPPGPSAIVTRGSATLKRAPDVAWVAIASETRAATPAEAQRLAAEAMTAVQSALAKAGLAADAIKTTGYSLRPDTEWINNRPRIRGYIARNQIDVRVDVLDRLGAVLDAAGSSGASSIAGLRFDLKNRDTVEREALRLAVEDGMARAQAIAAGARVTLGAILRIEDQVEIIRPPMPYLGRTAMESAAAPETPISPGEIEIDARVTVSVAIK
jgi:uncharacterized protein YggE